MTTPLIARILGWNPTDYVMPQCTIVGQETMSGLQVALARMFNAACWRTILQADFFFTILIFAVIFAVAVAVGLWWNSRRWPIAAAIFYAIFLVLYTSVFTNIVGGMASGMFGSLGYWLEQQEVQRGSQPTFYYLIVMPIYEFLPVIFSLAAIWLWSKKQRLHQILAYWVTLFLVAYASYSFIKWLYARSYRLTGQIMGPETAVLGLTRDVFLGLIVALFILFIGIILWLVLMRKVIKRRYDGESLTSLFHAEQLLDFMPYLTWWLLLTWAAYSFAGEKMPWLSTHFVIPMALMSGWYFGEKLKNFTRADLFSRTSLIFGGLTALLIIALFGVFSFFWLGKIQLGSQQLEALQNVGLLLGLLAVAGVIVYFWWQKYQGMKQPLRQAEDESLRGTLIILVIFTLLSLLTIRASYMASFPNADYTTEFMVYAHGAPATKEIVMDQVETLSMRLYGDKSIKVAYDNDVSWPFTWYLRDYPNRSYFGENPSNNLNESPIIVVGNVNWGKVEPYLGNNYEENTYTFLWWPMEEYRQIGWDSLFGDPLTVEDRGLADADKRQALWDIFFYRDYTQYGQAFGGTYTAREWPLRHELKVYTRKDVLASLWDQGIAPTNVETYSDPYAEGELILEPALIFNELTIPGNGEGQFTTPRNIAISPDGTVFVADSGNHRIQVFDTDGSFVTSWGEFGDLPGQLNEPWGIAADDEFVYVADTWNYRIQKFTHNGELVGSFGQNGSPIDDSDPALGLFYGPRDIALIDNGHLAITDTGNHRIQIMDKDGNFLSTAGSLGSQPGQFNEPVGLTTGPNGNVYLVDTWNGRVQELSPDIFPISEWTVNGWYSQSIDNKPYIAVDSENRIYVTDPEGFRVLIFDSAGNYLGRFGTYGTAPNQFALPVGIAIDAQDNVYVVDTHNNRVLKYDPIFGPPAESTLDGDDALFEGLEGEDRTLTDPEDTEAEEEMPVEEESMPTETPTEESEGSGD
jgi:sugar lactone lactonase YvrE